MDFGHDRHFFCLQDQLKLNTDVPSKGEVRLVFDSLEGPPRTEPARRKWPTEEQLHLPLDEEHRPRAGRPGSVWSLSGPCLARRWRPPSQPKAGKLAPAQFSHRAPRQAACRKSDLWLPLLIPIRGHVDLPGISDRAVYTAFSATFWSSAFFFPFFLLSPPPTFHARAGLTVSAVASPPPCRFLGHPPELGLAVLRAARAAALAGGAAGPCSALRLGRR